MHGGQALPAFTCMYASTPSMRGMRHSVRRNSSAGGPGSGCTTPLHGRHSEASTSSTMRCPLLRVTGPSGAISLRVAPDRGGSETSISRPKSKSTGTCAATQDGTSARDRHTRSGVAPGMAFPVGAVGVEQPASSNGPSVGGASAGGTTASDGGPAPIARVASGPERTALPSAEDTGTGRCGAGSEHASAHATTTHACNRLATSFSLTSKGSVRSIPDAVS